MLTVT